MAEDFARNTPRIAIGSGDSHDHASINITPSQMQPGNAAVVAERIFDILSAQRTPRNSELAPAAADLSGHWNLDVTYFCESSRHQLYIEQKGNWIGGFHTSDFSTQGLKGSIEGDQVALQSTASQPGDGIPFMFSGTIADGGFSGTIHLGEYLTAGFSAARASHQPASAPIAIPKGPPLAT